MCEPTTPPGFVEVAPGVFEGPHTRDADGLYGRCRVTIGCPDDAHNCDAMGCGQDHVVKREVWQDGQWVDMDADADDAD